MKVIFILMLIGYAFAYCDCYDSYNGWNNPLGCFDYELMYECQRAEFELVDYVNAIMAYARTLVTAHPGDLTIDALNMKKLSYAVELNRPVPDCATGVFTKTRSTRDGWDYNCYSPNLLEQCEYVKDNVETYIEDIITQLRNQNATDEFVTLMEYRVVDSIIPTVTCQTSEEVVSDNSGNIIGISLLILILTILI